MNRAPEAASRRVELLPGVHAVAPGLLFLQNTRTIVAADAHLAYEDVIGGALPTWSTAEAASVLLHAARELEAREVLLLGDVIHGSRMSDGAAREVRHALDRVRTGAEITLVAGNHEGRSRGEAVLGPTVEFAERDGWLLIHGDAPSKHRGARGTIIGHVHPSLRGGGIAAPAFLYSHRLVVVPALTPYSNGLSVCSDACLQAIAPFGSHALSDFNVVAVTDGALFPFGALGGLRRQLAHRGGPPKRFRRAFLKPDC